LNGWKEIGLDNNLLAEGMLLGMSSFGMEIIKWDSDTIYISVPRFSTDYGPTGEALAGKKLADRIYTKLHDLGCNIKIKYQIRDETWTRTKREQILSR
jgi:hypothetical protein